MATMASATVRRLDVDGWSPGSAGERDRARPGRRGRADVRHGLEPLGLRGVRLTSSTAALASSSARLMPASVSLSMACASAGRACRPWI